MLTILIHEVYTRGGCLHFLGCQENGEIIKGTMPTRDRQGEPCMEVIPTSGFEGMTLDEVKKNWGWGAPLKDVIEVKPWGEEFIESLFPKTATRWFIVLS